MKNYILIFFLLFSQSMTFPKGMAFRYTFLKLKADVDFIFNHIHKSHWQEIIVLMTILNPKIIPSGPEIQNPTHVFFGVILNKIEDSQIFQTIVGVGAHNFDKVKDLKMFSSSNIIESFKNVVKDNPFLIINTNELSKENNGYLKKYYFPGGYEKKINEKKIIIVSVAEDKIEDIDIIPGLFSNKNKVNFLHNLDNIGYLYGKDIGFFFDILGPALHITSFSKGEIILTYGDVNKCIHNKLQEIAFLVFFDKNYNFSNLKIVKKNLCSLCLRKSKIYPNKNKKMMENFQNGLRVMDFPGNSAAFYNAQHVYFNNRFFNVINNINTQELRLISKKEGLIFAKDIFDNPQWKFKYPWSHYEYLVNILFSCKEYVDISELTNLFDDTNHILDEFYIKPSEKPSNEE